MLTSQEYDSDALAMDILMNDQAASNIGQLLKCNSKYISIQQYMNINTKLDMSYGAVKLEPSLSLIQKMIPTFVEETFVDVANYMDKYILLHGTQAMMECNKGQNLVIDYNFHKKQECKDESEKTTETLYVMCRKNVANDGWEMRELLTWQQIELGFNVVKAQKPTPLKQSALWIKECDAQICQITNMLRNKEQRIKLIEHKSTPWGNRSKIPIIGRKSKHNKRKLISLQLTREQWVEKVSKFANKNIFNTKLIPIITSNGHKCRVEIVWIIAIEVSVKQTVNIGIALRVGKSYKKQQCLIASGIYLDINDEHRLVPYKTHNCNCLTDCVFSIYDLTIGNERNKMHQKYKAVQSKYNEAKKRINVLENLQKKATVSIKKQLCLSKMQHIDLCPIEHNEDSKQEFESSIRSKPLQTQLDDAQKYILFLENKRKTDSATIYQIKKASIQSETKLKEIKSCFESLWSQQQQLQTQHQQLETQQQLINNHQQMVSSLNSNVISLSLSQWQSNQS